MKSFVRRVLIDDVWSDGKVEYGEYPFTSLVDWQNIYRMRKTRKNNKKLIEKNELLYKKE